MPTLNWIGKDAVINHHKQVPFRLLKPIDKLSVSTGSRLPRGEGRGDEGAGNLLIQGDNLEALKALLPYYAGQVKCIYIDPPYNTGNESWVYNDNVNSPEMKEWLGKVVGGEGEDLSRHDKWLSMMYPRLVLLRQMLKEDGSLWMSIDDNEIHHARAVMDEIFGEQNFITSISWQKIYTVKNSARHFSDMHDYILVYAQDSNLWKRNLIPRTEKQDSAYSNPDNDPRGAWKATPLHARNYYSQGLYSITSPSGRIISGPPKGTYWRYPEASLLDMLEDNRIWWGEHGGNVPAEKRFLSEVKQGVVPSTMWFYDEAGHNAEAKNELRQLIGDTESFFITPKPVRLIQRILQAATDSSDLVLDSFAGSGTTGHAVLQANKEDGGNRRFILVEMDSKIAQNITAERLKRVAQGYTYKDQKGNKKKEEGLGGGFRYCELGTTLFDAEGQIREEVKYNDLAQHVYFIETGQPLTLPSPNGRGKNHFPLLGVHNGTAVYLLYNGILKDKKANGGNVLTRAILQSLPKHEGIKIIYGNGCLLSEEKLRDLGITFRQIPYEVKAS